MKCCSSVPKVCMMFWVRARQYSHGGRRHAAPFFAAIGTGNFNPADVVRPIDSSIGVIGSVFNDQGYLIDDISRYGRLPFEAPTQRPGPLRSKASYLARSS